LLLPVIDFELEVELERTDGGELEIGLEGMKINANIRT